ncbi:MAG: glycosyltransferase [Nitrospinae bacterium]|nr:glycosyltransferase [Nitrospinota bacterium]
MNAPPLSVHLPVRNGGAFLREAVESLRSQTFADFEILLVDDHSSDGAAEAVALLDPRIRLIPNEGTGVADAANTALAHSRAPLIARMDADDVSAPRRFEKQVAYLRDHPDVDVVSCLVDIFGDRVDEGYRRYETWINGIVTRDEIRRNVFAESPIPNPTFLMRREVAERLGGWRDGDGPEDYDFWLRAWEEGVVMEKVPEVLYRWRDWSGRTTRNDDRYSTDAFLRCRTRSLARTVAKDAPVVIWGAGRNGRTLARLLEGEGAVVEAFIDIDPRKIGGERRGKPVHAPAFAARTERVILAAVASRGAREEIGAALRGMGKVEGRDYWLVS